MLDNIRLQIMNEVAILYNIELQQTTVDELEIERERERISSHAWNQYAGKRIKLGRWHA